MKIKAIMLCLLIMSMGIAMADEVSAVKVKDKFTVYRKDNYGVKHKISGSTYRYNKNYYIIKYRDKWVGYGYSRYLKFTFKRVGYKKFRLVTKLTDNYSGYYRHSEIVKSKYTTFDKAYKKNRKKLKKDIIKIFLTN